MLAWHLYSNHENQPARNACSQATLHCGECPDKCPQAISMLCLDALCLSRSLCACLRVPGSVPPAMRTCLIQLTVRGDDDSFHAARTCKTFHLQWISLGPPIVLKAPPGTKSLAVPAHWVPASVSADISLGTLRSRTPMPGLCSQMAGLRRQLVGN